ncbi:hypothetical protein KJ877_08165 [bacterium]|nr:hypothetical protein [bacterium]MBU1989389.1 hypothetical protein [bacterium]
MPILHFSLVKLFASAYYTLYFLNLGVALFWLYKDKMEFGNKDIVIFLILMGLVYFLSIHAQTMIYDIYIYFDFTDEAYYTDPLTAHILIFLHLFLFLWTKEKKNLYFKNY